MTRRAKEFMEIIERGRAVKDPRDVDARDEILGNLT